LEVLVVLVILIGIFAGFFVQSTIGFAGALVALPILMIGMKLPDAICYVSIFYLISSGFLTYHHWAAVDKRVIVQMIIVSVIGISLGIYVLSYGKPVLLKRGLGLFVLVYILYSLLDKDKLAFLARMGAPIGLVGGFFSGRFSTGGPVYMVYVRSKISDMASIRATMIAITGITTMIRLPMLAFNNILHVNHLVNALYMLPVFLLAQRLGQNAYGQLNEITYRRVILAFLGVSGLSLLFN
jgi:uncharacterized membrane protein YfcA